MVNNSLNRKPISNKNMNKDYVPIKNISQSLSLSKEDVLKEIEENDFKKVHFKGKEFIHIDDFKKLKNTIYLPRNSAEVTVGSEIVNNDDELIDITAYIEPNNDMDVFEIVQMLNEQNNILLKNSNTLNSDLADLELAYSLIIDNYVSSNFEVYGLTRENENFLIYMTQLREEVASLREQNLDLANKSKTMTYYRDNLLSANRYQDEKIQKMKDEIDGFNNKFEELNLSHKSKEEEFYLTTAGLITDNRNLTATLTIEKLKNGTFFARVKNLFKKQ